MSIPTATEYKNHSSQERRHIQEILVSWWFAGISVADSFADLYRRTKSRAGEMGEFGYEARLLDEDAETSVVYGVEVPSAGTITIQSVWDEQEGPSVVCLFSAPENTVRLARATTGGIVELSGSLKIAPE
jgi:hypothetical protein